MQRDRIIRLFSFLMLAAVFGIASQSINAQSSDPDAPTRLTDGSIVGETSGGLSKSKTYYFAFNVKPGTVTMTTDIDPVKSTAGGLINWTYLTDRFKQLRTDVYSAQGGPKREIDDAKVTIKRKIILKLVVEGDMSYKIKLSGTGLVK